MQRKLPRFLLLSLLSFCFFTVVFHVAAYAQGLSNQSSLNSPLKEQELQIQPTPTIFVLKPTIIVQTLHEEPQVPSPTPTIYIAEQQVSTVTPTPTTVPTIQAIYNTTEIPAVSPTAVPSPTIPILPTDTPEPTLQSGPVDLETLFSQYSSQYGISEDELKKIASCESGFNTNSNTGVYAGMYQFLASTWESERGLMGLDTDPSLRMNPSDAIQTAAFMLSRGGENAWPNCH